MTPDQTLLHLAANNLTAGLPDALNFGANKASRIVAAEMYLAQGNKQAARTCQNHN